MDHVLCTFLYTHMHTQMCTHTHVHTHAHTNVHTHMYTHMYTHIKHTRDRIGLFWDGLCNHLTSLISSGGSGPLQERAIVSLIRLSSRLMGRPAMVSQVWCVCACVVCVCVCACVCVCVCSCVCVCVCVGSVHMSVHIVCGVYDPHTYTYTHIHTHSHTHTLTCYLSSTGTQVYTGGFASSPGPFHGLPPQAAGLWSPLPRSVPCQLCEEPW